MTREEIIKELHYKGTYSNEVKKRLRKLLKKYHPDKNKKDQKTIFLLYQIKKELENGTLDYKEDYTESDTSFDEEIQVEEKIHLYFLESMVIKLKKEKEEIQKKIKRLYQRWNQTIEDKNKKEEELGEYQFRSEEIEIEIRELASIDILDKWLIAMIVLFLLLFMIFHSIITLFISIVFFLFELYYLYVKYVECKDKKRILQRRRKKGIILEKEYHEIDNKTKRLEKREVELKIEEKRIRNDLQFYNHEISKFRDKKLVNEKEKEFVKK